MPTSRTNLLLLSTRLTNVMNQTVVDVLAHPKAKLVQHNDHDEDGAVFAEVETQVHLHLHARIRLLELKEQIEKLLEECKNDRSF